MKLDLAKSVPPTCQPPTCQYLMNFGGRLRECGERAEWERDATEPGVSRKRSIATLTANSSKLSLVQTSTGGKSYESQCDRDRC